MAQLSLNIRVILVVLVAVFALPLLSGCGGDDEDAQGADRGEITVEVGSMSSSQFIAQADNLCRETEREWDEEIAAYLEDNPLEGPTAQQNARATEIVETILAPGIEEQIDEVSSLGAPKADQKEITAILVALRQDVDQGSKQPLQFLQSGNPFPLSSKLAEEYGFTVCGMP